jgi:hypothetical protein
MLSQHNRAIRSKKAMQGTLLGIPRMKCAAPEFSEAGESEPGRKSVRPWLPRPLHERYFLDELLA